MDLIPKILRVNRIVLRELDQKLILSILDELVYRLSISNEIQVGAKFTVASPSNESREELEYDGTKNCILKIENCLQQLRKKLKPIKKNNKTKHGPGHDLGDIERHIKQDIHQHMWSLNQHFGLKYDEVNELEDKIRNRNNEIERLNINLIEKDRQITSLTSKLKDKDTKVKALQQQFSEAEAERLQEELQQCKRSHKRQIEQIYTDNNKEITRLNEQLKKCDNNYKFQIQQIITENDQNIARFKSEASSRENIIKHLFSELEVARAAKEDERKQKDDVLTRLSAVAGDRLRNNNPGITDLSDPNRPMKIAEKFTEMYDNDWTDSMEALEDLNIPEEKCVEILLHLVTDSYEECGRILHDLNGYLEKAVIVWECEDETNQTNGSSPSNDGLPAEITKPIKDLRRKLADNSVFTLQKKLPQHLQNKRGITEDQMKACKKFIEDCIRYTWVMQMQDPPVHIEWEFSRESTIDTNILRSYTRAGDKVDFVVWPVLYLHKDGPVLNKGVVQPIPQAQ